MSDNNAAIGDIEGSVKESPATIKGNIQTWVWVVILVILLLVILHFFSDSKTVMVEKPKSLVDKEVDFVKRDVVSKVNRAKIKNFKDKVVKSLDKKALSSEQTIEAAFKAEKQKFLLEQKIIAMRSSAEESVGFIDSNSSTNNKDNNPPVDSYNSLAISNTAHATKGNHDTSNINDPTVNQENTEDDNPIISVFNGDPNGFLMPATTTMHLSMQQDINSDYEGYFEAVLNNDVYDVDRHHILIPRGSPVFGQSRRGNQINEIIQSRMVLIAEFARLPNGSLIRLTKIGQALDNEGIGAISGQTNLHLGWKLFGAGVAALVNTTSSFAGTGDNQNQSFQGNIGENVRNLANDEANKYLKLVPTIVVKFGQVLKFKTTSGIKLPSWERVNDY